MTTTFHFNRRDASFRYNISSLTIDEWAGKLVTKDHRVIQFDSISVLGDEVAVFNEKNRVVMNIGEIDHVAVEVD